MSARQRRGSSRSSFLHGNSRWTTDRMKQFCGRFRSQSRICSNEVNAKSRKSHTQNGRKLHGVSVHPCLTPPWHHIALMGSFQFPAPPLGQKEKSGSCLQHSGMSNGFLGDCFLFCLLQRSDRNKGIIWISDWRSPKAVAGTVACENYRGTANSWVPSCKRLWGEEYHETSKNRSKTH